MSAWERAGKRSLASLPGVRRAGCRGTPHIYTHARQRSFRTHQQAHSSQAHLSLLARDALLLDGSPPALALQHLGRHQALDLGALDGGLAVLRGRERRARGG